jgi:hypothetical protein
MQVTQVPQDLFLIFTIAVVISVLIQAGVFLGLYFVARTAASKAEKVADDMTAKALPIIVQTRTLLEDLSPKIRVISANLAEISTTLKDQTKHVNTTVGEVVDKTKSQAERVDEMVTAVLDGVTHASATIQSGVGKPVRKINGFLEGLRVAVETFVRSNSGPKSRNYTSAPGYRSPVYPAPSHVVTEPVVGEPLGSDPLTAVHGHSAGTGPTVEPL